MDWKVRYPGAHRSATGYYTANFCIYASNSPVFTLNGSKSIYKIRERAFTFIFR